MKGYSISRKLAKPTTVLVMKFKGLFALTGSEGKKAAPDPKRL
jgi:hypothetical protein